MPNVVFGAFNLTANAGGIGEATNTLSGGGTNVVFAVGAFTGLSGLPQTVTSFAEWNAFAVALDAKATEVSTTGITVNLDASQLLGIGGHGDDSFTVSSFSGPAIVRGGAGNDTLSGGGAPDQLLGENGNDSLTGSRGNDILDGGADTDTATYFGNRAEYTLSVTLNEIAISDNILGRDGFDTVRNVEFLRFADGTVAVADLFNSEPSITSGGGGDTAAVSLAENATAVTTVTASDPDAEQELTYSILPAAQGGGADAEKFTIDAGTGVLTFIAAPDFEQPADAGADNVYNVTVQVSDGQGGTDTQAIVVTVANADEPPTAVGDTASVSEDGTLVASGNVLTNDSGVDGAALRVVAANGTFNSSSVLPATLQGIYGSLHLNGDGTYTYTLDNASAGVQSLAAGQTAFDQFSYSITDNATGDVVESSALLSVEVTGSAPTSVNDTASVSEDGTLVASGSVLTNDSGVDGAALRVVAASGSFSSSVLPATLQGIYGSLHLNGDGTYTYTLDNASAGVQSLAAGQTAFDQFSYSITDNATGDVVESSALLSVEVTGSAPTSVNDTASVSEDGTLVASGSVLTNDSGVDGAALRVVAASGSFSSSSVLPATLQGIYGSLHLNGDGTYTYTLDNASAAVQSLATGQTAFDQFSYSITDNATGDVVESSALLSVEVTGSAPTSVNDTASVSEDGTLVASGNVLTNDSGVDGAALRVVAANGTFNSSSVLPATLQGIYGSLHLNADGTYTYTLDNATAAVQSLAAGQTAFDQFNYSITDSSGEVTEASATLSVQIQGTDEVTNAPPVITSGNGDTAATTVVENTTVVTTVTATDVDAGQALAFSVVGGADAALFTIDDNTGVLSFLDAPNFEAPTDVGANNVYDVTVQVSDGNGGIDTQAIAVTVSNRNEPPVISTGPAVGNVREDEVLTASGTLTAADEDAGAIQLWSVIGGNTSTGADYTFAMDSLNVIKNGASIFADEFDDGSPPPAVPAGSALLGYGVTGSFAETGGRLVMDDSGATPVVGVGTPDPFIAQSAVPRTNIDPANQEQGLKSDDNFTIEGRFDLVIPDSPREAYGIRLSDRLQNGSGIPPDQPGDDVIELVVLRNTAGSVVVTFHEFDFAADQVTTIQSRLLNPPIGADQIMLRLTHATTDVGAVHASFDYLANGSIVGSQSFTQIGRIFGTETPGFAGDNENWTRASIIAYAPQLTNSTRVGTYGTLNINQAGAWTYTLANGQANVQALAAGQTATDDFAVQVSDGNGAFDTENISITVTGSNDAPTVAPNISVTLNEDTDRLLTAADFSFADVDMGDQLEAVRFNSLPMNGQLLWDANGGASVDAVQVTAGQILSRAEIDVGHVFYRPALDGHGTGYSALTYAVSDGEAFSAPGTMTFDVAPVNDAPVHSLPSPAVVTEDEQLLFNTANDNSIIIADTDIGGGNATVTLSVLHGTLTLASTAGLTFATGDGTADATMSFSGTASSINAALNGLSYRPSSGFTGMDTLSITTNDQGNTGAGGPRSDTDTLQIDVTAANDAPTAPPTNTLATNEDTTSALTPIGATDADGDTLTYSLKSGFAPAKGSVAFSGDNFTYTPNADINGTDTFTIVVSDSQGGTAEQTVSVTINPVNDAPLVTGVPASLPAIDEDTSNPPGEHVLYLSGLAGAINDARDVVPGGTSGDPLFGIAIVSNAENGEGVWQYSLDGSSWTNVGQHTTTNALVLQYFDFIRFLPNPDFSGPAPELRAHAIDGLGVGLATGMSIDLTNATGGTSHFSADTFAIQENINPVNDQPVLSNLDTNVAVREQIFFLLDTNVSTADADLDALNNGAGDYEGASVQVLRHDLNVTGDAFRIDPTNALFTIVGNTLQFNGQTFAVFGGDTRSTVDPVTGVITARGHMSVSFTSSQTPATTVLVNDVLRHISYANESDAPPSQVVLRYTFVDGNVGFQGTGGNQADLELITVNIAPINDAPVLDLNGVGVGTSTTLNYTENQAPTPVAPSAIVSDIDSSQFRRWHSQHRLHGQWLGWRPADDRQSRHRPRPDRCVRKCGDLWRRTHWHLQWRREWRQSRHLLHQPGCNHSRCASAC